MHTTVSQEFMRMNKMVDEVFHVQLKNRIPSLSQIEENADRLGIALTNERWQVIRFVRDFLKTCEKDTLTTHMLCQELKKNFYIEGGYKYMYQLFPEGPVNTICKLLGIELVNADEKQFGVIH